MSNVELTADRLCGCQTGIIYVRRCGRQAPFECSQCGLYLCEEHAITEEAGSVYCPDCQSSAGGQAAAFDGSQGRSFSSHSGSYYTGSDSTWVDDSPDFADEDYAAFDALSDFDVNADDGHAYDS